jgi:hypothetical protein
MIALHTFDMEKIRETTNYKEMVDASGGNQSGIDLVCQQVMDKLQETKRQMSPEQWNDILNDLTLLAGVSDLNDTPQDGQCRLAPRTALPLPTELGDHPEARGPQFAVHGRRTLQRTARIALTS